MPREWVIFGMAMPTLVPIFFVCILAVWILDKHIFTRWNIYRRVAHPPLFRIAVFVLLFSLFGLYVY